jgi:sigma-E factor negative regulatory protein RseB
MRSETSRITRYVDAAGDIEKLEVMDGVPREIVRTRDTVRCYLPESRVVKVDRRTERGFPALVPERIMALARHYDLALGETRRIAGYDCQAVELSPKDNLRYGYRLYADIGSGMLLRAVTLDPEGNEVENFTFTQLSLGNVTRDMVKPRRAGRDWRVENTGAELARLDGWGLTAELPGFRKVTELKRRLGESRPVGQMVYSDGLAAVSVFIEPLEARRDPVRTGLSRMGAIHIYTREVANHRVTVVGEAPASSVQRIADSVEYHRSP